MVIPFCEQWTFSRILNVVFQLREPTFARLLQHGIDLLQCFDIAIFAETGTAKYHLETGHDSFQNRRRIGNQNGSCRRPADDQQFSRLDQHLEIPMLHQITADHGSENNQDPNYGKHRSSPSFKKSLFEGPSVSWLLRADRDFANTPATRDSSDTDESPGSAITPPIETVTRTGSPHHSRFEARASASSLAARSPSPCPQQL